MVGSACKDPCFCTCLKIWLWCPECTSYRKLRHRFLNLLAFHIVDDQTETVSKIDQGCCNTRACLACEYKSCRIFSVTHGKRAYFNADLTICDRRAYLKHMRLKDSFFSRYKVICIVFHHGSSFCIFYTSCHDLHQTNHCSCLPVTFCTESIAFFHKSLDCKSGKLFKSTQISKVCNDCLIIFLFQEFLKSDLNLSLNCYMTFKFFRISSLKKNIIFAVVFIYQRIYITFSYIFYIIGNLIYRISINFPSEFDLCFYFITFCNSYVSHVICYTTYADMAALHDTNCCTHPGSKSFLNIFICPVSDNNFSFDSHSCNNMTIFTTAMSRLVFIHKIHINGIIRNLLIKLCMKMAKRFSVFFQTKDP